MYSNAKAVALIRDLSDKLSKRLQLSGTSINSIRQAFSAPDAAGGVWPYLVISENGNEAEGQPVLLIEIAGIDMVSKDIFGNDTDAYAPHKLLFGYELGAVGNETLVSHADLVTCEFESIKTGVAFSLIELPNGTAVTQANVAAATPVVTLDELYWPTKLV